jgi:hypothetical protein
MTSDELSRISYMFIEFTDWSFNTRLNKLVNILCHPFNPNNHFTHVVSLIPDAACPVLTHMIDNHHGSLDVPTCVTLYSTQDIVKVLTERYTAINRVKFISIPIGSDDLNTQRQLMSYAPSFQDEFYQWLKVRFLRKGAAPKVCNYNANTLLSGITGKPMKATTVPETISKFVQGL